ncbi:hypothetical protein BLNAU_23364 [Blattamonas nauphoetae]|uniref:Uncharacterized protein n=1 Tax=Blattamonas nauphoetae TaxID=2049346 RepID=A0ABQ9WQH2_9EUKA|nr:hypothetical protein BLNAU_23364 [Blattamonas nauphoetae]
MYCNRATFPGRDIYFHAHRLFVVIKSTFWKRSHDHVSCAQKTRNDSDPNQVSHPISAICFNVLSHPVMNKSPLQPERGFALQSSNVVTMLLEGAEGMTRNGMWQTTLEQKTPFPASSVCAVHQHPHPRQSSRDILN